MKVIQTNGVIELKIIPRFFTENTLIFNLKSESTNEVISYEKAPVLDKNYLVCNLDFGQLKEGEYYTLDVLLQNSVIYKDKVFCTDQNINQENNAYYTVNKDEYVEDESGNNDFIIL